MIWLEVILLTLGIPAVGFLWSRQDPFFLDAGFPLAVVAPALIGLRYGISLAVASAVGIVGAATLLASAAGSLEGVPLAMSVGTLLSALICGQFHDSWARDRARYEIEHAYQAARIEQITHSYGILLASHSKLEERLCAEPLSFRAAMTAVRERLMVSSLKDVDVASRLAETILELFAEYGQVQVSAVYRCVKSDDPRQRAAAGPVRLHRLAERGASPALSPDNPLLCEVLRSNKTAVAAAHQFVITGGLQAIAPIRHVDGQVWGVVCVSEMGALDDRHRTLELLTLIADYVSDGLHAQGSAQEDAADGGQAIGAVIDRWCRNAGRYGLGASLLVLRGENRLRLRAVGEVLRARSRTLDHVWVREAEDGGRNVLALLPLTSVESAMILMQRVEEEVRERGGIRFVQAGIRVDAIALTGEDSSAAILRRLEQPSSNVCASTGGFAVAPQAES
ncbi:PelD GGDEF domain-containing protein [Thiocystis violacea]|uniref:PelD GGDEF domain-containing protein n=1 Tax=Thiocystis violacea TaxID=13725 RepID=UPI0019043B92